MSYILTDGTTIFAYPYSLSALRVDNPDISFPSEPSDDLFAEFGVFPVEDTPAPAAPPHAEVFEDVPAKVDGKWVRMWAFRPAPVPQALTPIQARRALRAAGYKAAVDAYVQTLSEEEQETWEYATEIHRDNPIILAGAAALQLTQDDVDNLFRLGSTL